MGESGRYCFREKHENDHRKLCHYLELHEQRRHGLNRWCKIMRAKNYILIFVLLLRLPKKSYSPFSRDKTCPDYLTRHLN